MIAKTFTYFAQRRGNDAEPGAFWAVLVVAFCAWLMVANLGRARLFEPDEGRNAEIAREIVLLDDWVTPHYDFLPRLDKPIFFFDLVALSYRLFGISEWSARLPAVLEALGCLLVTYRLSRAMHGRAAALWSVLILVSSIEFFALSQIVIMDMLLAFFLTLGMACFFWGERKTEEGAGQPQFLCMYLAFAAATLVKGPIGILLPAMIIALYIVAGRRWELLQRLKLPGGVLVFLLVTAPWYAIAEIRNPGFLQHFLLQENLTRFASTQFHRSQPWYFYFVALPVGFFPWSAFLPMAVTDWCRRQAGRERPLLFLWIVTPLLFLSLSSSKMAHYTLPIFPPLAVVVGATIAAAFRDARERIQRIAAIPAAFFSLVGVAVLLALLVPAILPGSVQAYAVAARRQVAVAPIVAVIVAWSSALAIARNRLWRTSVGVYCTTLAAFALLILASPALTVPVSEHRSSRLLAQRAAPHIRPSDQLVLYSGYPSGLPFYLKLERPMWVVWSADKRQVLGSDYIARERPEPASGYAQVLFSREEFADIWKNSEQRLLVFVSEGSLGKLKDLTGTEPIELFQMDETFLVANRSAAHSADSDD